MTWIKICGITNLEDAITAVESGTNALGFIFYPKSKRKVEPKTVKSMVAELPGSVERIGVFVEESSANLEQVAVDAGLTGVQLHLQSIQRGWPQLTSMVKYLAFPATLLMEEEGGVKELASDGSTTAIFIDSGTPSEPGGTGKVFDWDKACTVLENLRQHFKIVVAGGLTPSNVAEAIRILKPWGVDVSSGVESTPGKKDPAKIRDFIQAVRQTETSL